MSSHKMKAIVCQEYGPPHVLKIKEVETPIPGDQEILVRVMATTVNYGDLLARNFKAVTPGRFNMPLVFWVFAKMYFGINRPKVKILGSEFAGEIIDSGKKVQKFKKGDKVFGYLGQQMGAYAEYICMDEKGTVTNIPEGMSFGEAAPMAYGPIMALHILRKMNIQAGQKVLVIGASGGIGSAAVQIAKNHYRAEITGICSGPRAEYVKALGADHVIDYLKGNFTDNRESYDLIFDILGKDTYSNCKKSLKPDGRYLRASFKMKHLVQMVWTSLFSSKKVICTMAPGSQEDLVSVKQLAEEGKIKTIIDRRFAMDQAGDAHQYVEEGQKKGNIVINVG